MHSLLSLRAAEIAAALVASLGIPTFLHAEGANWPPSAILSPDGMASESLGGAPAPAEMSGSSRKTRAQVKQELEQAQQSGEMNRINEFYGLPRW